MAEKVTVRFEQFDSEASGDIITSGPLVVDGQLETTQQLGSLVLRGTSGDDAGQPQNPLQNSFYLEENESGLTLLISNAEGTFLEYESIQNGMYYFSTNANLFYQYKNNGWSEKPVQSILYYVRNVFDSVAPQVVQDLKFRGAYFSYRELTASWQEVLLGTHTHENKDFLDRLGAVDIDGPVGTKKFFTLEIKDTDDSEATYEYDLNWEDFPNIKGLPETPEGETDLYLGYDENGNPEWKNNFIAAQTFQLKSTQITSTSLTASFEDVLYDQTLDDVLVLAGKFFVYNRAVQYNPSTRVLTVTLVADPNSDSEVEAFEVGETVSILIIRNGAASILDTLAKDYVTKSEAITLLTGGSVNLNNYVKKTDLTGYAKKYHTHSQFARADHDHDYRYAMFNHTHSDYLTRNATLSLIEEVLAVHPDILTKLQAISDYLVENSPELATLATKTDLADIQAQINTINSTFGERVQTFLDSEATVQSERVLTNFVDQGGNTMNLDEVLTDLRNDLDGDYGNIDVDEVFVKDDIPVILAEGETQGNYKNGDILDSSININEVLIKLLQREIIPTYEPGELDVEFTAPQLPEVGELINLQINPTYIRNDSGLLNKFEVFKKIGSGPIEVAHTSAFLEPIVLNITPTDQPTVITVTAGFEDGLPKYTNIDTYYERFDEEHEVPGKILAGDTNITVLSITGKRALFYGGCVNELDLTDVENAGELIRSNFQKVVLSSNTNFEINSFIPANGKHILFALPESEGTLTKILYRDQGTIDILSLFQVRQISIPGANGVTPIFYKVYCYTLPIRTINEMNITFIK
jgi:hypothetical protein